MSEVEFTSELMILVRSGISDNNKATIDSAYKELDDTFPNSSEAAKRVRHVLKVMDDNFRESSAGVLESKGIAYPLFAAIYDFGFDLKSPLTVKRPRAVPKAKLAEMLGRAERILNDSAPKKVLLAAEARSSQAKNRRELTTYLKSS